MQAPIVTKQKFSRGRHPVFHSLNESVRGRRFGFLIGRGEFYNRQVPNYGRPIMNDTDSAPLVPLSIRGRGAAANPPNRFEALDIQCDPENLDPDAPGPKTIYLKDTTRSIIARNDSPDIGFTASVNPYRGCEHGCVYCYARPYHEYLGFSAGLDFETKIVVKENAPELLRQELSSRKWKPQVLAMSGVTDCYQPIERRLQVTRKCLQVLAEFRNPVTIITKNLLVTRDIDLLRELAAHHAVTVYLSINSLDSDLARKLEPR